jgi:hypothetical protein
MANRMDPEHQLTKLVDGEAVTFGKLDDLNALILGKLVLESLSNARSSTTRPETMLSLLIDEHSG